MKRITRILSALSLLALLQACPQASSTDPIVGTWGLTAVNGTSVPDGLTVMISSNGTWTAAGSSITPSPQSGTWSGGGGTYTIVNNTVAGTWTATLSGNTMTIVVSAGLTETFTRQ